MRAPVWLAAGCAVMAVAHESRAQSNVTLRTTVSDDVVEVGQSFRLEFTVMSRDGDTSPAQPRLPPPRGATVQGPSVSTQHNVSMVNGRIDQQQGFTATWLITPRQVGTLSVGPPSAVVAGKTVRGLAKAVKVVPAGQAPARRRQDPFDLLRRRRGSLFPPGLFGDPFDLEPEPDDTVPEHPPEYSVDRAADPVAFLRSVVQPKRAVVGEQVTLDIYAYGSRGRFREYPFNEPRAADFVAIPIVESGEHERFYQVEIGERVWTAIKVRELALFPLRTGDLSLGGMKMGFYGGAYSRQPEGLPRSSELLTIHVDEPPLKGRPPGYRIGDVGRYRLQAEVTPRKIEQGGAIAVNVTLSGVGNLPTKLETPQKKGIEWLEPQVSGDLKPEGSVIKGVRHFTYVVRLHQSGQIDLGELSLPHYDPKSKTYRQARVELGRVEVTKVKGAHQGSTGADNDTSLLSEQLKVRTRLGPNSDVPWRWTDSRWFWALIGLSPLSVLTLYGSIGVGKRLSARYSSKKKSATTIAGKALAEAKSALAGGDKTRAAGEMERALFLALEAATGVKARGVLRAELVERLTSQGLPADVAEPVTELLAHAEAARFTGQGEGFGARQLDDAVRLVRELSKRAKAKSAVKHPPGSGASA